MRFQVDFNLLKVSFEVFHNQSWGDVSMKVKNALCTAALIATVAGSMTTAYAAGTTSTSASHKNWQGHGRGHGMMGGNNAAIAKILGISQATLTKDLQAKESLVQIAATKKVSEATLIKDMESNFKKQMDAVVKSGKMTSAQEKQMVANYNSHVKQMVEQKGFGSGHRPSKTAQN